jgi:pimeloyl-ACP methyl ester carboxylesterase
MIGSVRLDGAAIRCWFGGSGEPLLYLHGVEHHPGDAAFLHRLAAHRRVVAPEHPGYGESATATRVEDVLDLVLHHRRLVEAVHDGPVDVVGHCFGAMVAAELAALAPDLVRRLVLVAPLGIWIDEVPAPDLFVLTDPELDAAKWHDPTRAHEEPSILGPVAAQDRRVRALARNQNLAVAGRFLWPLPDRGLRKRLPHVRAETLVVRGASDGLVPAEYAKEFAALIPGAELAELAGAGHLPLVEVEAEACELLLAFLDRRA